MKRRKWVVGSRFNQLDRKSRENHRSLERISQGVSRTGETEASYHPLTEKNPYGETTDVSNFYDR